MLTLVSAECISAAADSRNEL